MIYIIATPIGNLKDITIRALEALNESELIYCEDTRNTSVLLNHYEIKKKLVSFHEHNELKRSEEIIAYAKEGKVISIVSDAGMPGISDPGSKLIGELIRQEIEYTVLPGPSAFTTALVYSGLNNDVFKFIGFLPVKGKARKEKLEMIKNEKDTVMLYEAPHKLDKTMADLVEIIPNRRISVVRELTKIYESQTTFLIKDYENQDIVKKGEMVLVIDKDEETIEINDEFIIEKLEEAIGRGLRKKEAVSEVVDTYGLNKNRVYKLSIDIEA
ncbi:MAG: 16S rRNA (cytidine(1402)-2'-O)-methyltransferase [Tissierellia bacterium]|nr:16S rRNA (cytidine(1402)-2'-O)-methyltransferase [Tissierellia bacterium]